MKRGRRMKNLLGEFNRKKFLVKLVIGIAFAIFGVFYGMSSGSPFDVEKTIFEFFYAAEGLLYGHGIMARGFGGRDPYVGYDAWGRWQNAQMHISSIIFSIIIGGLLGGILFLLDAGRFIYYTVVERKNIEF